MATLTVRHLDDDLVRRLRVRAADHGRSAEAEHREILRAVLAGANLQTARKEAAERLASFRTRTTGRGSDSVTALLSESRSQRLRALGNGGNAS